MVGRQTSNGIFWDAVWDWGVARKFRARIPLEPRLLRHSFAKTTEPSPTTSSTQKREGGVDLNGFKRESERTMELEVALSHRIASDTSRAICARTCETQIRKRCAVECVLNCHTVRPASAAGRPSMRPGKDMSRLSKKRYAVTHCCRPRGAPNPIVGLRSRRAAETWLQLNCKL
jgi:hypothetical protein